MFSKALSVILIFGLSSCASSKSLVPEDFCLPIKIADGVTCNKSNGPLLKLILVDEEDNPKVCSAVMISPTKALTASHCFDEFVFGAFAEVNGEKIKLSELKVHPMVEPLTTGEIRNDLAILEIPVNGIQLEYVTEISQSSIKPGDTLEFYGFGQKSIDKPAGRLRKGLLTVSSIDKDFIRTTFDGTGANTCYGDSGGPLFLVSDGKLKLSGILTSGTNFSCSVGDVSSFVNLQTPEASRFVFGAD